MQDLYITAFQNTGAKGRKEILEGIREIFQKGNKKEIEYIKKVYDEIKEILFQEGKRPM